MHPELSNRNALLTLTDTEIRQTSHLFTTSEIKNRNQESINIIPNDLLRPSEGQKQHPNLHLINTRLWINQLRKKYDSPITITSVPQAEWQLLFDKYDSFWFMGIFKPSHASRLHCQKYPESLRYAKQDVTEGDIVASPFAVCEYSPNPNIAKDWGEWDKVIDQLHQHGKSVILDFVPNHVAIDHPWAKDHPEYFIQGKDHQKQANPNLYYDVIDKDGELHHLAHGKDPNYPEWSDTLQLNYANPDLQLAMEKVLLNDLLPHCDGLRCDMAMLLNPETFIRTWGHVNYGGHLSDQEIDYIRNNKFWPRAIAKVKEKAKELGRDNFTFIAEAYWDLQELGQTFDFLYEKDFYDHLIWLSHANPRPSSDDLKRHIDYLVAGHETGMRQHKSLIFTENHDENRATSKFGAEASMAAAVITAFIPNNVFLINQGQDEGRRIRPPMQLEQPLEDPVDSSIKDFYDRLLTIKNSRLFQDGKFSLLPSNFSNNPDLICQKISLSDQKTTVYIVTNFSSQTAYSHLPSIDKSHDVQVSSLTDGIYIQNLDMERRGGLFLKLRAWESQIIVDY